MGFFSRTGAVDPTALGELTLFRGLSDTELKRVAKAASRREIPAGEMFIEQGRIGMESFAIAEGLANVYMNGNYVTSVGPGVIIGEMALLGKRPRNATLIAETDLVAVVLDSAALGRIFEESPELAERVTRTVERRMAKNSLPGD